MGGWGSLKEGLGITKEMETIGQKIDGRSYKVVKLLQ